MGRALSNQLIRGLREQRLIALFNDWLIGFTECRREAGRDHYLSGGVERWRLLTGEFDQRRV